MAALDEGSAAETTSPTHLPRVHMGELLSAGSALILLISMFAVKWYGVAGVPDPSYARPAISSAVDGWNALTGIRWLILATVIVAVGSIVLHVSQLQHGVKTDTSRLVTALSGLTTLLLAYRILIELPSGEKVIDQKLGAFIALVAALGVLWGGCESIAERRRRPEPVHHRPPRRPRTPRPPRRRRPER